MASGSDPEAISHSLTRDCEHSPDITIGGYYGVVDAVAITWIASAISTDPTGDTVYDFSAAEAEVT
ncbi:MAG: M20/M25/M40 family metallo-hydrolase, partial [Brevibacterium aurantiacum]